MADSSKLGLVVELLDWYLQAEAGGGASQLASLTWDAWTEMGGMAGWVFSWGKSPLA